MDNSILVILAIISIVISIIFIVFARRSPKEESHESSTIQSTSDRIFKLAELKRAGNYNWDDSGCVFEVNSDGSVTIVGRIDPAELLIDPKQELYDKFMEYGLFEMLPKIWGVYDPEYDELGYKKFWLSYSNTLSFITPDNCSIECLKTSNLNAYNSNDNANLLISTFLKGIKNTVILLLPINEKEFILSLGAQECIKRFLGTDIVVRISSPATMGALWFGMNSNNQIPMVSFAFGESNDYKCCNLKGEDGLYEVMGLLPESVIRPLPLIDSLNAIARGCYLHVCIINKNIDAILLDLISYPISIVLKKNDGEISKIYNLTNSQFSVPRVSSVKGIEISQGNTISLLIGSYEIINDIVSESGILIDSSTIDEIMIDIDVHMSMIIKIKSGNDTREINIGNLIG